MKRLILVMALIAPIATSALAEIIDFEDINIGGTRADFNTLGIQNSYRGYVWTTGASTFGQGIWGAVNNSDSQFLGAHGGVQAGWTFNGPLEMSITFDVDKNVSDAWFNVFMAGQDWGADAIRMRGYTAANVLVGDTGFVALDDVNGGPPWVQVVANFSGVRTLTMTGRQDDAAWTGAGWWAVDDLTINTVPEPFSIVALGAGLVAIAARRRRK